jgi:integrase
VATSRSAADATEKPARPSKPPKRVIQGNLEFSKILIAIRTLCSDLMPLFRFSLHTAQRQENCFDLDKKDVLWERGVIRFKSITPDGEEHLVPITPKIEAILREVWDDHPAKVFTYICKQSRPSLGRRKGQRYPMTISTLRKRWDDVRAYLGIPDLNWHRLRATAATYMKRATRNKQMTMKWTNHKDEKAFDRYTEADTEIEMIAEMLVTFDIEDLILAQQGPKKKPQALKVIGGNDAAQ